MVMSAITEYPELWRAAVNYYGIADFVTMLAGTGAWRRNHRAAEYGDPERDAALFARISPIHRVDRIARAGADRARHARSAGADRRERAVRHGVAGAAEEGYVSKPSTMPATASSAPTTSAASTAPSPNSSPRICAELESDHVSPNPQPSRSDHGPQRRGRRQSSAGDPGRSRHAARRRQRGRCVGGDLADTRRGRAGHVGPGRRRILPGLHGAGCDIALLQRHRCRAARRDAGAVPCRAASRCVARSAFPRLACSPASARCTPHTGSLPWRQLCGPAIEHAREGFAVTHHYRHFAGDVRAVLAADARSRAVFLGGLDVGVPPLAALIRQPDLARTLEEIAQDGAETFYRGRLAKPPRRRHARGRRAGRRTRSRGVPAAGAGPDRHRLSRLPRHADAAELHRLHHAADAEDRRALRPRRARSGAAHPRAGGGEEARVPRSRALRHRSALRRRAARPAAVGRLRR